MAYIALLGKMSQSRGYTTLTQVFNKLHPSQLSCVYHVILVRRSAEEEFVRVFTWCLNRVNSSQEMERIMDFVSRHDPSEVQDEFEQYFDNWLQQKTREFLASRTPAPEAAQLLLYVLTDLIALPPRGINEWIQACSDRDTTLYVDALMKMLHKPETEETGRRERLDEDNMNK